MDWYDLFTFAVLLLSALVVLRTLLWISGIYRRYWDRKWQQRQADIKAGKRPPFSREKAQYGTISIQDTGFTAVFPRRKNATVVVAWDQIEEIRAFKRDLYVGDLICWEFRRRGDDSLLVVYEDMVGFKELQKAVEGRFGVKEEDWWHKVIYPASALSLTVSWPKDKEMPNSG